MGTAEITLCHIVEKVRSWMHPRTGRSNVLRDFWMPDHSCRVCYECDLQFTIFNRRHHCRICGRVFCRKCTLSTVPAVSPDGWTNSGEETERIRVCNFCFKQWEQEIVTSQYNGILLSIPAISPSPSVTGLALSSKSSVNSSTSISSMPYSNGPCQEINNSSGLSPTEAHGLETQLDREQDIQYLGGNTNFVLGVESGGSSPSFSRICTNRSDDEDDEYGKGADDPRQVFFRQSTQYFRENGGIGLDPRYIFHKVHPSYFSSQNSMDQAALVSGGSEALNSGENINGKSPILQTDVSLESQFSTMLERSGEESEGTENADECNDVSSVFEAQNPELEQPVDFENNGLIWVPPEPEDEEDEIENSLLDDEDEDDRGGWGLPRAGSFSNNENKSKDRSIDEHRKAMRTVVDGHFRALVAQLLKGEEVPVGEENDKESWLEIVTSLSWQAATLVKPDTSKGGGMDPGGYVKVKCIACGRRSESEVIKGVVCKKNVAHRRMRSRYKNPRLMLLGGALEYQRVSNQLSSLDTLLQQEMDHLKMTVAKIEAHHPNVLLVEKTVSRYAQEYLLAKEISLVLNIKKPLLERIARCTGAQVASSVDNLTAVKVGHCELFHVEKFLEEHGSAGQAGKKLLKTLMFFEGCPKPLGCTVLLKGANGDELKKVKRVAQYAVFAAYHLALETSFLADEGATLPELPFRSPITVALPDKQSGSERSISTVPGFTVPVPGYASTGDTQIQDTHKDAMSTLPVLPSNPSNSDVGTSKSSLTMGGYGSSVYGTLSHDPSNASAGIANLSQITVGSNTFSPRCMSAESTEVQQQDIYSASEGFAPPYPLSGHLISGLSSSIRKALDKEVHVGLGSRGAATSYFGLQEKLLNESVTDDGLTTSIGSCSPLQYQMTTEEASTEVQCKDQGKVDDHMKSKIFLDQKTTECKKQDAINFEEQGYSREDFPPSPSDQQSILVSLSTRCVWKGTVCERAHLFRIKYYGSFDKPLGRFLRDDLFDQNYRCRHCDAPTEAHVHCYTHRQGSLTISVRRLTESILPGEREGKIWMWHRCLKCARKNGVPQATRRVVMSDAAWGLSFGKFLELSFSNHAAASRVASCGHSLHRDCLRFYGFGRMVACFRYAAIHVHSVHLPPPKLEFNNPNHQEWLRKEALEVTDAAELFFAEVYDALRQIGEKIASCGSSYAGLKVPESRRRISELEVMLQKEKAEFEELLGSAVTKDWKPGQPFADILRLNHLRRGLMLESYIWDHRLRFLDSSLRVKNSVTGSNSSLQDLNASLPKESMQNIASEKLVESHSMGKNDNNAGGAMISRVDSNGCMLNGNGQGSCSYPDNVLFKDIPVDNNLVITDGSVQSASMLGGFPESLLVGHFMKSEGVYERLDGVGNTAELPENRVHQSLHHVKTSTNVSVRDSSAVEDAIAYQAAGKENDEYDTCSRLSENTCVGTVDCRDRPGIFEGDPDVHRTLSKGCSPILADLSDKLDAAWTGEGHSVVAQAVHVTSQGQEHAPPAPATENTGGDKESTFKSDSDSVENSSVPSAVKIESAADSVSNVQDKGGLEVFQVSVPSSPIKSFDISEDIGSWIGAPFSNLYKAYEKVSQGSLLGSPSRLVSLSDYIPTFVSSVNQLCGQGGARLFLPTGVNDTVVVIYDDEPTSIIAYALTSHEYQAHVSDKVSDKDKQRERDWDKEKETGSLFGMDGAISHPLQPLHGSSEIAEISCKDKSFGSEDGFTSGSKGTGIADPFLYTKAMHVKVSFSDESPYGKVKYTVTCYYAKQFDALRRKCCPTELEFIRSLCRCKKWGAQGGKSNVFFAKTLDERFIVKQVTKTELESFIKFAPEYFKYLSDSLSTGSPTCLAKILGIYQVTGKHAKGGKEVRMDLMVMENLLYGRNVTRVYDLKGSARSRYNPDSKGSNTVLLDQNLLEAMPTSPIFVGNKAKRLLERAVWNDTSFLASVDVMDYSLLVGIDEERRELVLGIIDFMRQYTWDKHLETWVKASGILGGPKNTSPTVISPKQYKKRFRKAMSTYFLMVPDQWSPPTIIPSAPQIDACDDKFLV